MSKIKKTFLFIFILFLTAFNIFASGQRVSTKKEDTIIFQSSHDGYSTTDVGFYIPSKQVNLDLMTYGKHYSFEEVVNTETNTTTTKLVFTEEGKKFIKDKLKVVEIKGRVVGNNFVETMEEYSIDGYEKEKGVNLTEILSASLLQYAEKVGLERLEENSGFRNFQEIVNLIYKTLKDKLKQCYSLFALGKETINSDLKIQEALNTNKDNLTSDVDINDRTSAGRNYLAWILFSLLSFELILVAVSSFVKGTFPATEVIKKFFICLMILFFISNIWSITELSSRVFVKGGNILGGYDDSTRDHSSYELLPGDAMEGFFKANAELDKAEDTLMHSSTSYSLNKFTFSELKKLGLWVLFLILKIILFVIYAITALYVLLWQIELYLLVLISTFLLPFWIFRYTNFLTKGIPQTLLGQCVKIFTATLVIRLFSRMFDNVFTALAKVASESGWSIISMLTCYLPGVILISIVVCYFTLKAPETTRAVLSGTPTSDGNIHGLATRMGIKAITLPYAFSTAKMRKLSQAGTTLYGASRAHVNEPGAHKGREYAFTRGGVALGLLYSIAKPTLRKLGIHNTEYGRNLKNMNSQGIGTDPNSPNLSAADFQHGDD